MSGASIAQEVRPELRLGVAAPTSGASQILGEQVTRGASLAASALGATVTVEDEACTEAGGSRAANAFVEARVAAVVGFLCTESLQSALPILKDANIPVITVGVRTDSLTDKRDKSGWPIWRLAPRADGERAAVADILVRAWRDALFAIVDDGTIYGREMAEAFRAAAEQAALKPVFVDTFRPQMDNQIGLAGRLRKAGATHVFVGGDRDDVAVLGRDAAGLGMQLTIAGGENLRAASGDVPLSVGTLMIAVPEWAEKARPDVLARFAAAGATADGYALPAYAAVEIVATAVRQAASEERPVAEVLDGTAFPTVIGTVDFDTKGDLTPSPYVLYRYDGTRFVEVDR